MNAVLILPSFRGHQFGKQWRRNPMVTPPLGLLYVGGALERSGFNVRVLDLNVEKLERSEFCHLVRAADLVGVSVFTVAKEIARAVVEDVRRIHPGAKVICGGPHINSTMQPFPGTDVTFMGEGEETAGEICRHLVQGDGARLREFQGLYYCQGGEVVKTGPPVVIQDLNRAHGPARHLMDASRYGTLVGIRVSSRIAAMTTSRGCPYKCSFCVRRGVYRYRHRDPANVVDEIQGIVAAGHDLLVFNEDNFTVVPQRSMEIMREVKRRGLKIRMMMQIRVDSVTEELLAAFKEAGVWSLIFGIESGTQEVLDYYEKETTVEQGRRAVELADRLGIFTYAFFILGAPPERDWHFRENVRFMTSIPLDFVGFNILDFQFGSRLWSRKLREGLVDPDQVVVPTGPPFGALSYRELERYLSWSYRAFYLRPLHYWRILKKCRRTGDFTLLFFILRFSLKLLRRFQAFALTEDLPGSIRADV
ncbi:MAG: cobalamin B12-binding domain-containing protein [Acidobacteria bacterium]|nr:cobalamin B12-binding domain-containing protein [Acidobacteriota bacterium]